MPNLSHFNNVLFNWWRQYFAWSKSDDIIFNGFWLQNENFVTSEINFWNMPKINVLTYDNPKNDWWWVLDRFYKQRTITLSWSIIWTDSNDIENKIDSLKKALSVKTWYLDFKNKWTYRRILCTLTNSDIINREHYDIDHWKFKLTFTAQDPFWSEKTRDFSTFSWVNAEINEDITNEWSEYSNPIINILVNSCSETNQIKVKIWNDEIKIETPISTGDVIEINTAKKNCTINSQSVDFSGRFQKLQAGLNSFRVISNWTYNFDIAVLYSKNYL